MKAKHSTFWQIIWKQYRRRYLGLVALFVVFLFVLVGIYAPFLASSKPLAVQYEGNWYFPLFKYLFYLGFYSKRLDIFYNLLMFTFPLFLMSWVFLKNDSRLFWGSLIGIFALQGTLFLFLLFFPLKDPAVNPEMNIYQEQLLQQHLQNLKLFPLLAPPILPNWKNELNVLNPYARLNMVLRYQHYKEQDKKLKVFEKQYHAQALRRGQTHPIFPSLWNLIYRQAIEENNKKMHVLHSLKNDYAKDKFLIVFLQRNCQTLKVPYHSILLPWIRCDPLSQLTVQDRKAFIQAKNHVDSFEKLQAEINYIHDRQQWLEKQEKQIHYKMMPLIRPFHWEDDAGGDQGLNHLISWWDLTRINRKDMVSALVFGIRISLSVGLLAIGLALLIGIPVGAISGYYGGKVDLMIYRLIEIWESMPTFFMLLMIVAFLQSKSIFLVIAVIGLFGWTGFSRFIRGEFFRQKQMLYVEACHALGYRDRTIIFSHLLPNAIPPLLTLVPFAIMGAITSEAGLSFLGLGEEGSNSWGVLMDEGRSAFPSESYLLWPPAILLTILLVSIALVGDSLRDVLDPKLHV